MKKMSGFFSIVFLIALCSIPLSTAAATLSGVWKGSANKAASSGCTVVSVTLTTFCAKGKIATARLALGKEIYLVHVKISAENTVEISTFDYGGLYLYGRYVAGPPAKIIIDEIIFPYGYDEYSEYDTFTLTIQ